MELEELKKSWNALDEHLKDKELIKEDELERLIGHADKGIHAIARLNIRLILISLPILILFLTEVILHNRFWHGFPLFAGISPPRDFFNGLK